MSFLFLNSTDKIQTYTGTYNTQQMSIPVKNWRIMDYEIKIFNAVQYILSTSDKIYNVIHMN